MGRSMRTHFTRFTLTVAAFAGVVAATGHVTSGEPVQSAGTPVGRSVSVTYGSTEVDGLRIAFREAGPENAPQIVLLHGFPTSSHMFRDLIPKLATTYRVIAPDYPGFGLSDAPPVEDWEYSFDNMARVINVLLEERGYERYMLYVMDYGAPVGFRIATEHPDRIAGFVVQNGNAYEEGLREFWDPIKAYWADQSEENEQALRGFFEPEITKWQYTHGTRRPERISPDNWLVDQPLLDRPGNAEIQLKLFLDYGTNPALYPQWQAYFRTHQPPMLIVWGKNDMIFPESGAHPYLRDLPDAELHLFDTGHFALEEDGDEIAGLIREFVSEHVAGR